MPVIGFPPIENADEDGLLALGGDLKVESLFLAYSLGIFPWPISEDYPLAWFAPDPRGIIQCDQLHISKSMLKVIRKNNFIIKYNTNFDEVIKNCADSKNRQEGQGTWILEEIIEAYSKMHQRGYAYCVEVYINEGGEELLVGGLYGICIDHYFSGESMFYKVPNASKIALIFLIKKLKSLGIEWIDTQMVTPVISSLGGEEISRDIFMDMLKKVQLKTNRGPIIL